MYYDPRVERKADLIVYHIQTNEGMHLSDKSRHDIFNNVRDCADYWKIRYDEMREENTWLQLNELRLWLRENKPEGYEIILDVMNRLRSKEYIRGLRLEDLTVNEE